jgi:hypothetical protein
MLALRTGGTFGLMVAEYAMLVLTDEAFNLKIKKNLAASTRGI